MTGAAIGHLKAAECLIILISDSSAVPLEVHIAEKYHYPRQVYVARDPGCCEVVSGVQVVRVVANAQVALLSIRNQLSGDCGLTFLCSI